MRGRANEKKKWAVILMAIGSYAYKKVVIYDVWFQFKVLVLIDLISQISLNQQKLLVLVSIYTKIY